MNTWSWIAWLATVLMLISAGRNPLFLVLVWLALLLVYNLWLDSERDQSFIGSPLRLSILIIASTALFNALTSHFGETRLLRIPGELPLLSGAITLEALAYGAINGMVLASILTAFMIINQVLPMHSLVRLVPRAYYALIVVMTIAIAFLPSTRRRLQEVREAQAIRGRRTAGIRDYLALLMPVLIGGLEHAIQLAETMTSRGFVGVTPVEVFSRSRVWTVCGLLLVLTGLLLSWAPDWQTLAGGMLVGGGLLTVYPLWAAGRHSPRTAYHPQQWKWIDGFAMLILGVGTLFITQALPGVDYTPLSYTPYPGITFPAFTPEMGFFALLVLFPVLAYTRGGS